MGRLSMSEEEIVDTTIEEGEDLESDETAGVEEEDLDSLFAEYSKRHGGEEEEESEEEEEESEEAVEDFKLKINGEEVSKSREEVIEMAQKAEAANAKFEEASNILKNVQDILVAGKSDPVSLLSRLGIDANEFILEQAERILDESDLSPEEVEIKKKEEALKKREEDLNKKREREEMQAQQQKVVKELEDNIATAIESSPRKPSRLEVAQMAEIMLNSIDSDEEIDAPTALRIVQRRTQDAAKEMFSGSDDIDKLLSELPKEAVEKIRRHFVNKAKPLVRDDKKSTPKHKSKPKRKVRKSIDDLLG